VSTVLLAPLHLNQRQASALCLSSTKVTFASSPDLRALLISAALPPGHPLARIYYELLEPTLDSGELEGRDDYQSSQSRQPRGRSPPRTRTRRPFSPISSLSGVSGRCVPRGARSARPENQPLGAARGSLGNPLRARPGILESAAQACAFKIARL